MRAAMLKLTMCAAIVGGAALICGCGSSDGPGNQPVIADLSDVINQPLEVFDDDPGQTERWRDIADHLFSDGFMSGFEYGTLPVTLDFAMINQKPTFTINAGTGALKPNFCYQMKVEGPSKPWTNDPSGADFTNAQFGYNGRWWCDTCSKSLDDVTVTGHMRKRHYVKGYLYFDFLVPGADGSCAYEAPLVNSYHVTWRTDQTNIYTRQADDGPVREFDVVALADPADPASPYATSYPTVTVGLFGEQEPGRPLAGQLALAEGAYEGVEFRLTEESFHSSLTYGGNWRTVMRARNLSFTIGNPPAPAVDLAVTGVAVPPPPPYANQTKNVQVTVANQGDQPQTARVTLSDNLSCDIPQPTVEVSLFAGQSSTVEITWTPLVKGTHTLVAEVAPVPGETDISDNVMTKTVKVK